MNKVYDLIEIEIQKLTQHKFILWLKDNENLCAEEKFRRWIQSLLYFPFAFADLNKYILKYPKLEAELDPIKEAINEHCEEDSNHWAWFLEDIKTMGLNESIDWVSALKFIFGKELSSQRKAYHDLIKLFENAKDPIHKYALMHAFERGGHITFTVAARLSETLQNDTGKELLYFGKVHLDQEIGHLMCSSEENHTENAVWSRSTSKEDFLEISTEVVKLFKIYDELFNGFYKFCSK